MKFKHTSTRLGMLIAALVALFGLLLPSAATATPNPADAGETNLLQPEEEQELRNFFESHGVPAETQDALIEKLERGEPWDVLLDVSPVSVVTAQDGSNQVTVNTYPDGSIAVIESPAEIDPGTEGPMPLAVSECSTTSSPIAIVRTGCKAQVGIGIITQGFYFNYECVNGGGARITSFYSRFHQVIGGSTSDHRLERMSNTRVRYSMTVKPLHIAGEFTAWMEARVNVCSAWTVSN